MKENPYYFEFKLQLEIKKDFTSKQGVYLGVFAVPQQRLAGSCANGLP
jgi:hypothetical protein